MFYLVAVLSVLLSPVNLCTIIWNKSKLEITKTRRISLHDVRSGMAKYVNIFDDDVTRYAGESGRMNNTID